MDVGPHGDILPKKQGIRQENCQRSKIPLHPKQRELCLNLIVQKKEELARLERKHYEDERKLFELNVQCEEQLMTEMKLDKEATFAPVLSGLEAKYFGQQAKAGRFPSGDKIKAFIKVRSDRTFTLSKKPRYQGVSGKRDALIQMALAKRSTPALQPLLYTHRDT